MSANPLIEQNFTELARTVVAVRALATTLGFEWEKVLEAADGMFQEAENITKADVTTEGN